MQWSVAANFVWPGAPDGLKNALHRGRWAGHRIDLAYIQENVELEG